MTYNHIQDCWGHQQPICYDCIHYHGDAWTCDAFPEGIPFDLAANIISHTTPYEGDGGIQFSVKLHMAEFYDPENVVETCPRPFPCHDCKHIHDAPKKYDIPDPQFEGIPEYCQGTYYTCDAFPEGIPEVINVYGADHTKPFPGDNGIQFEPKYQSPFFPHPTPL